MKKSGIVKQAVADLVSRAHQEVDQGLLPSCQIALAMDNEIVHFQTIGKTVAGDATRYVVFSASKAIVSAAFWQLIGEGRKIRLTDRVADHLPEFGTNGKDAVTIEQLLTHQGGFPRSTMMPPAWDTVESRMEEYAKWTLQFKPGSKFEYHITSAHWVQADILGRLDKLDYREAIRRRISVALGLKSIRLGVPEAEQKDIATPKLVGEPPTKEEFMAALGIPGIDVGEAIDAHLAAMGESFVLERGVPGGNAVATAADFALFFQALLHNPGGHWDAALLPEFTMGIRAKGPDLLRGGPPANRSLGGLLVAGSDKLAHLRGLGYAVGPRAFGHDGAGGQTALTDPDTGLTFVYLTDAIDRHLLRQWKRIRSIATRGAQCAEGAPKKAAA
ncbi:MAG: serine hydrolase domain-containing protein [Nevskiales bacterium]